MLIERVKELSKFGELITGDKKERTVVDKIKEFFEEKKLETRIYPLKVLNWKEDAVEIECEGKRVDGISMPYSPSIDTETESYKIIRLNNILEINKYIKIYNDRILIFTLDNHMRKFVLKNGKLLSHLPQDPPRFPAFYVREKDIVNIKDKCRFYLNTKFQESTGYVVEAINPGHFENKIYVTAHHDHWLSGEHDDLVGVSLLPELSSEKYELHLVSFTAEESGCFYSSFSWGCGSFNFLKGIKLENVSLAISLDNVTPNSKFFTTPGISGYFQGNLESPSAYSDSYNFLKLGIPSVTLSDINYPYYHSDADFVNSSEDFNWILHQLNNILSQEIKINLKELKSYISRFTLSLELRSVLFNLMEKGRYNEILKFYGGILDWSSNVVEVYPFHRIIGIQKAFTQSYVAIEDFDEINDLCENEECKKNRERYLSYLLNKINEEYLAELKNLF